MSRLILRAFSASSRVSSQRFFATPVRNTVLNHVTKRHSSIGGIETVPQIKDATGALWISNTYRLGRAYDILRFFYRLLGRDELFLRKIQKEIDDSFDDVQFPELKAIIPNFKEHGVYVTFATRSTARRVLEERDPNTNELRHRQQVNINGIPKRVFLVQGRPFIEDTNSMPTPRLYVELIDGTKGLQKLNQEMIFNEMRTYGRIEEIVIDAKKESAFVHFTETKHAIAARNCLHHKSLGDAVWNIRYEPYSRWHIIWDLLKNPKFYIPGLGIAISLSLYLLVNPTRIASVTQSLTRGFRDDELYHFNIDHNYKLESDMGDAIRAHLRKRPDSIVVVSGPAGSGKSHAIKSILHKRTFTLRVDCSHVRNVNEFIEVFGDSMGFSPSFNALNTTLMWLESFIPGLKKTALSPSIETQLKAMFKCLDSVLWVVSTAYPSDQHHDWDYAVVAFDRFTEFTERAARGPKEEQEKLQQLKDILLDWVAKNSTKAHFVFVSGDPFGDEKLLQHPALRQEKVTLYDMPDLSVQQARNLLRYHVPRAHPPGQPAPVLTEEELLAPAEKVGGRVADLESLLARVNSGIPLERASELMVAEAEALIRDEGFGPQLLGSPNARWTQVQLWKSIKRIVKIGEVPYDELLFLAFSGDQEALRSVIRGNLLRVSRTHNGTKMVTAFSPLYMTAFQRMLQSEQLALNLDRLEKKADIKKEQDEVDKIEEELQKLSDSLQTSNPAHEAIKSRQKLLNTKMAGINGRLEKKELELQGIEQRIRDAAAAALNRPRVEPEARAQ